ncbi:hypothetical protein HPB48_003249 [Haemaphysalis longicornis]|uniref:Uncharacterized protein n=1 Tax=Haemaphysalis longicornis TaxID=44386 RepID=A0A9J6H3R2_HAELO|nr:hypothetical protein HPB48_003249 [Haemaphysalis longicornis]
MHINATHLSGNEFLNFFYLALVEIPANAIGWWSMDRFGRRWTNVFFMLLTATSCWAPVIAPTCESALRICSPSRATQGEENTLSLPFALITAFHKAAGGKITEEAAKVKVQKRKHTL